ncbi:ATP-binding protein [Virgibacillus ainsalahensis]
MIRLPWRRRKRMYETKTKFSLKLKMIALISLLLVGVFLIFSAFLHPFISSTLEDQIGKRALSVAQSVANIPEVSDAFRLEDPSAEVQHIVEPIREETGAEFIVVGNKEGIRYSHPEPERIGEEMIGGDNERALEEGMSYVSESTGSLGLSIRGKTPVYNDAGEIIGIVSVGFLNQEIQGIIADQSQSLWLTLIGILLLGIGGAIWIAHYLKQTLSGMEPEEISRILLQKEAILQSTHEGIIAVDNKGLVTMMNTAAKKIIFKEEAFDHTYGRPVEELLPHTGLYDVLGQGHSHYDREMVLGDSVVLVNRMPVYSDGAIVGALSTFRRKTELEHVTNELLQIKQYANAQRAQTHEFSNKLYTILGLLQLDQKQEAFDFLKKEKNIQQEWSTFLTRQVKDPMVHGLLLGKHNQANELGIEMNLQPESQLSYRLYGMKQNAFLTGLGNLLENAIDAVKHEQRNGDQKISVFFTDIGNDIVVEVEDSGPGIAPEDAPFIFVQGFSTKESGSRGTGLALSRHLVLEAGGEIVLEEGELGGACFVMIIPKEGGNRNG